MPTVSAFVSLGGSVRGVATCDADASYANLIDSLVQGKKIDEIRAE
jgi:hypothetical protein